MVEMATCDVNFLKGALGIQQTGPRTVIVPADPIEWSNSKSYEYLTIVTSADFGQAYISKKDVPSGTPLTNTEYWIPAATFNAQLAAIQTQLANKADKSAVTALKQSLEESIATKASTADLTETKEALEESIATKASTADLTETKEALEESITAIGTVSGVVDNDKGFVQDSTNAVMLPGVGGAYASAVNLHGLASIVSTWGNSNLKLGYDNTNAFRYDSDGHGGYTPHMPTDHMNSGYLPIDCAVFAELVANNIIANSSPYSGSSGLTSQGAKMFDYLSPTVIPYWSFMAGGEAGRMLTWQYAKYLEDRGLLTKKNFTVKPGMHVFFGNASKHPNSYMGIYHCAIVTNLFSNALTGGDSECWVVDCGGGGRNLKTKNCFAERKLSSAESADIVAGYFPAAYGMTQNLGDGFNYLMNSDATWTRFSSYGGVDTLFNTTASPITFTYVTTYSNDTDGNKGGISTTLTLPPYKCYQVVRCANTVKIRNGSGIRILGETLPGLAAAANEATFSGVE